MPKKATPTTLDIAAALSARPSKPAVQVKEPLQSVYGRAAVPGYVHFSDKMTGALRNIGNVIDDNKSTLDSIQDMSVELTRTIRSLQAVIIKYVDMADNILETLVPILDKLPLVPDKVVDFARDALELSKKITAASELAERVLPGVEASLMSADVSGLQASTGDVAKLTRSLQDILPRKA